MGNDILNNTLLRAALLTALLIALAGWLVCGPLVSLLGGHFSHDPEDAEWLLSEPARALIEETVGDYNAGELRDYHTHLLGHGDPEQATLHADFLSWLHPLRRMRAAVFLSAAGVSDLDQGNEQYLARLIRLVRSSPGYGRHYLLAFDRYHDDSGVAVPDRSDFYVSNAYAYSVAERYPELFLPAMSIHPYRPDAIDELNKWAEKGVRLMKWLPNSQGIDPADPRLQPFYEALAAAEVTLLTHAGEEQAVEATDHQGLGNPLRLRPALDAGVKVIVAHAASLGEGEDLDDAERPPQSNLDLFLRMMDEPQYEGLLFGEISSVTQANRHASLESLLQRPDLHQRLVNGSDYPLPAVNMLIRLNPLVEGGYLDSALTEPLREIYDFNPLLFDLVLKRSLRLPATELGFAREVFLGKAGLAADE